jgi:hypothetical protein
VRQFLASGEFRGILREAVEVSNTYLDAGLDADTIDLRRSPALHATATQVRILTANYDGERALYYRDRVPFDDIVQAMRAISDAL